MAAFISLFISSIACAESWVLWEKIELVEMPFEVKTSWEIRGAFPDYNQCLQAQKRVWQVIKNRYVESKKYGTISEIKEVPYELIIIIFKKSKDPKYIMSGSHTLYCLPGGLDPREKK